MGFISMVSKVKIQEKNTERLKFQDFKNDRYITPPKVTRHVLSGQIPPATTPLYHRQQLCKVLSPSKLPVKGYCQETKFSLCVNCDLDLGDMNLNESHAVLKCHPDKK